MRLIYLGSGEFGVPTLEALSGKHELAAVVTQPDRPAGRHRQLTPTPVAQWAQQHRVKVIQAEDVNSVEHIGATGELRADAAVIIAFGQKLSPPLLRAMGALSINLHASLLPKYRGAAPINWAIISGETQTGLSVIALSERMDAGLVYAQSATAVDPLETAGELHDRLALMSPAIVLDVLAQFEAGKLVGTPQDEEKASRAPKLSKKDGQVRFDMQAKELRCRVHGLTPWPGVRVRWSPGGDGDAQDLLLRRVASEERTATGVGGSPSPAVSTSAAPGTVLEGGRVAVADGCIRLLELQAPGGRPMPYEEFVHGHPLREGDVLRGDD